MGIIRTIIADDEELALRSLRKQLHAYPEIEILAECENGFDTVKEVLNHKPHLLFLDIQMPELDGFDVLELLGKERPFTVFVTAYDEYALRAFEAHAQDYLLKPVSADRLKETIELIRQRLSLSGGSNTQHIPELRRQQPQRRILVREQSTVHILPESEIFCIEAQGDYMMIHSKRGQFVKYERMSRLQDNLDPQVFIRVHRSYLVNLNHLGELTRSGEKRYSLRLKNGLHVPVSRSGYTRLSALL